MNKYEIFGLFVIGGALGGISVGWLGDRLHEWTHPIVWYAEWKTDSGREMTALGSTTIGAFADDPRMPSEWKCISGCKTGFALAFPDLANEPPTLWFNVPPPKETK